MSGGGDIPNMLAAMGFLALVAAFVMLRGIVRRRRRSRRRFSRSFGAPAKSHATAPTAKTADRPSVSRFPSAPLPRMKFWVIDGDTIRDNSTTTVYRLANIDCPETGELA